MLFKPCRLLASLLLLTPLPLLAEDSRPGAGLGDHPRERAEWNAEFRRDENGFVDGQRRLEALRHACRLPVDPSMAPVESRSDAGPSLSSLSTFPGTGWQSLGPRPINSNSSWGDASGRVTALATHPTDPSILLAGAATGGIWKSTDGGATWRAVADTAPTLAMSAIVFSPSNPNVLYAATGEADSADLEFRPSRSLGTYLGAGVLRSVDLGETWTRIDTNLPANSVLSRVLVHPTNPQLVLAGIYIRGDSSTDSYQPGGMWRSTDGGVTFAKTFSHAASDLAQDPNVPDVVYAAFGVTGGCGSCTSPSGVYRSTDFGATFSPSLVSTTAGATFLNPTGNIKLGLSRTSPVTIFASVLDTRDSHAGGGIYRSTDAGATWTARGHDDGMCPDSSVSGQCEYDHWILPSPTAPDTVYFGGIDVFKSTDGGGYWTNVSNVYGGGSPTIHPDQHAAVFPAGSSGKVLFACDGGIYSSTNGGTSFASLNATLTLAQFNGIALHPTDASIAMGGTQDNGNLRFTGGLTWSDQTGGDGGFNLIRVDDPKIRLAGIYYNVIYYTSNSGDRYARATPSLGNDMIGFYPPAAAAPSAPGTVFVGSTRVWASTSFGNSGGSWTARSSTPIVSASDVLTALEVVGDGDGVIWAGTRLRSSPTARYRVSLSTDGGKTFTNRSTGLPNVIVATIRTATSDGTAAYVALGGFSGLPSKHVFRTTDSGQTWTNISGELPDVPVATLAIDPGDPNDIFIGTDVGVFRSRNGGASWSTFNQGLPNVSITDLRFHAPTGDLWAATYGRGAYRIPFSGGDVVPSADFSFGPSLPAPGQSVAFTDLSAGVPTIWSWDFGDAGTSTLQNPRHAFVQAGSYQVTLVATNGAGSNTARKSVVVLAGVGSPVTLQVPVVLDVFGVAPTHFTSDLVAVNRSGTATRLTAEYLPAPGTPGSGGPRLGLSIESGREWRVADVLAYLRASGYELPASGTFQVGTLRLTFEDVSDASLVFAGSRTSTPNPDTTVGGSFGLFSAAPAASAATSAGATILALRENSGFRSNLAVVDVPGGSGPAGLSFQVWNGDTGAAAGAPITYALKAGEWHQLDHVLSTSGVSNGYVTITKTGGGSDRYITYGVVNEAKTGDGSLVGADGAAGLVPIVLSVDSTGILFTSELVLVNAGSAAATTTLAYTPSSALGGSGGPYNASVSLGAGRQLRIADAIAYFRDTLHMPLPASGNQGGTLLVSGATAYVRTSNPNPDVSVGGSFGLAYPAVPTSARAKTEAWVYGLVQDAGTRSNLAIADGRVGDSSSVTYLVDVYNSDVGATTPVQTVSVSLAGGQWWQKGQVLAGGGATHGYVRVRPQTGTSDFVIYGILNDGANPGERTSDGSFVAMSGVR